MDVLVLSDTHARGAHALPESVLQLAGRAQHIVHAGDHSVLEVVRVLEQFAAVTAVHGNVDDPETMEALPTTATVQLAGVSVGVIHNAGPRAGRHERLQRQFPGCGVIVYGHSHMPETTQLADGTWVLNPGSPTQPRRAPFSSAIWLTIQERAVASAELLNLG